MKSTSSYNNLYLFSVGFPLESRTGKTGIIRKFCLYLNIIHNFCLLVNYQEVQINTLTAVSLQYQNITVSYMFRPYRDHHQEET